MEDPFRVLEHTADIGFEAYGANLAQTFSNAARALVSLTLDLDSIRPAQTMSIRARGNGLNDLLVNWLSEVLYLEDAEKWFFSDFEMTEFTETALTAQARGEKYSSSRHSLKLLVKAVTYHQLALERTSRGWRAQVYVDI
jgi:SHS2 domain-containing protein